MQTWFKSFFVSANCSSYNVTLKLWCQHVGALCEQSTEVIYVGDTSKSDKQLSIKEFSHFIQWWQLFCDTDVNIIPWCQYHGASNFSNIILIVNIDHTSKSDSWLQINNLFSHLVPTIMPWHWCKWCLCYGVSNDSNIILNMCVMLC